MLQYLIKPIGNKATQNKVVSEGTYRTLKYKSNQVKKNGKPKYAKTSKCTE